MERFHSLSTAPASERLRKLAQNPFDLTTKGALVQGGRIANYSCNSGLFRLLYSCQRVDEQVIDSLQELADQCGLVEQYRQMRRGSVANRIEGWESEDRQVLHTASRDVFSTDPKMASATVKTQSELDKLKKFLLEVDAGTIANAEGEKFTSMVHVGIGGSDLGPRSIYEALKPFGIAGRSVHFIANVDPDDAASILDKIDLRRCLINIVSKSGTTLETLTNERLVVQRLREAGLNPANHCIAVTGQGSPMDNPQNYLRSFYMFDYIGGRYSTTSMVGAVMLGFYLGYEKFSDFLKGADSQDNLAENSNIRDNLPLLLALLGVWNHNFLGYPTLAVLPYSQALHRFPAHLQQCDMESNGKSIDRLGNEVKHRTGPIIWGEPGTNGQHAFYQLLHQGTEVVPMEFIGFKKSQFNKDIEVEGSSSQQKLLANMMAQAIAFACGKNDENPNRVFRGNRPSSTIVGDRLTPQTMGALLAIYEAKIVFQGFCWDVNSFEQEGVQLGKVLAGKILDLMKGDDGAVDTAEGELLKVLLNTN
jgi:glucose-6-phosphate isomerase